jgi:hypothetical protein
MQCDSDSDSEVVFSACRLLHCDFRFCQLLDPQDRAKK